MVFIYYSEIKNRARVCDICKHALCCLKRSDIIFSRTGAGSDLKLWFWNGDRILIVASLITSLNYHPKPSLTPPHPTPNTPNGYYCKVPQLSWSSDLPYRSQSHP